MAFDKKVFDMTHDEHIEALHISPVEYYDQVADEAMTIIHEDDASADPQINEAWKNLVRVAVDKIKHNGINQ